MNKHLPLIISIGHQLGSGGAYIGQKLSEKLNIFYADREIIHQAAEQLAMLEEEVEAREEKITSFWQSFLHTFPFNAAYSYIPSDSYMTTDKEFFEVESEIIDKISREQSSVIMGRCSNYILRNHPNHISVFLHGSVEFRTKRIQEIFNVDEPTAEKMILRGDDERTRYNQTFGGKHWMDVNQYDISVNTSKIGLDKSVELIMEYINEVKKR